MPEDKRTTNPLEKFISGDDDDIPSEDEIHPTWWEVSGKVLGKYKDMKMGICSKCGYERILTRSRICTQCLLDARWKKEMK